MGRALSNNEIIGSLFDSDKTYFCPNLSEMEIGRFDLYTSTFYTFVNLFWHEPIIDINRIERKFRIQIPRYKDDWVDSKDIFNPNTGNFYSFEYFQIALSNCPFKLYTLKESSRIHSTFSELFSKNVLACSVMLNDLNQAIHELSVQSEKTFEHNGSYDDFRYSEELLVLKSTRLFLNDCKAGKDWDAFDSAARVWNQEDCYGNLSTKGMFYAKFHGE